MLLVQLRQLPEKLFLAGRQLARCLESDLDE